MNHKAFEICAHSQIPEAVLAYQYWTLSIDELVKYASKEHMQYIDLNLAKVYFEWLDDECRHDMICQELADIRKVLKVTYPTTSEAYAEWLAKKHKRIDHLVQELTR
jgi:hypothetical protein